MSADRAALEAEVRAFYDGYLEAFGGLARGERSDLTVLLDYYAVPWSTTGGGVHAVHTDARDVTAAFGPMVDSLRRAGYDRSVADRVDVRIVNDRAAIIDAAGDRIDRDGRVMHRFAGVFFVARTDEGWRTVAVAVPDA